jgi:putative membrane protein
MSSLHTKDWFDALLRYKKTDILAALSPLLVLIGLYTWLVVFLELEYLKLSAGRYAGNVLTAHSLLSFALSILLVFRTNTAYDRWWEGRKLWGQLVNVSRNLALKMRAFTPENTPGEPMAFFARYIPLYAAALRRHLQKDTTEFELLDHEELDLPPMEEVSHLPNLVAAKIFDKVNELYVNGHITGDQLINLNGEITALTDICGACERIKNTPIPLVYSTFIKRFVFAYCITLPFGLAFSLGYFAIPITIFIFYVMASLELIAEEIEEPFGKDTNDIPMEKLTQGIQHSVVDILETPRSTNPRQSA